MTYNRDSKDPNLNNLHAAMEYNSTSGKPQLRVNVGEGINITGTVNVPGIIQVQSSPEDPVDIHIQQVGTSGILDVPYMPIQGTINGTVSIGTDGVVSLSSSTLAALERITVDQGTSPWVISKDTNANSNTNPIYVNLTNNTLAVTGTFWQATQPVSIATMPTTPVTGVFFQETQPVSGTVTANVTFPTTQQVSGTVALDSATLTALEHISVDNFPATQTVNGTVTIQDGGGSITVDGSVSITSLPEVEIKNDSGNPISVEWVYGNGASLIPWEVQVARGKITGVSSLNISGYNGNVGTTYVPIWYGNTTYVYPASATQMRLWSDSASDTNVSVTISGLDSNYALLSETITLSNGSTGVLTINSFLRINTLNLSRAPTNVGNIFCGNSAKTEYYCVIEAGAGRSQQTIYTVPAGYTFYLEQSNWYTNNTGNNVGLYRSWTTTSTGVVNIILQFPFPINYNSKKTAPRPYLEKTDIQWQAASKSGGSAIGGQIEGFLIANSVA